MADITLQVLDGVDKGRVFRGLSTPVTIGREEGNHVRLNDERVSRFHAKVQQDRDDLILTDLQSTNGTLVNGNKVSIRRLRHGDCITVGRSVLLFGSSREIAAEVGALAAGSVEGDSGSSENWDKDELEGPQTIPAGALQDAIRDLDLTSGDDAGAALMAGGEELPPLPTQLTPSQAARLAEILDLLHRSLAQATQHVAAVENGAALTLDNATWQRILSTQMLLARYLKAIVEPDSLHG